MTEKRAGGRPTEYTDDMLAKAEAYANGAYVEKGDVVPTIVGMALYMGLTTETLYVWSKHEDKKAFSDIFTRVWQTQHQGLVNGSLRGELNPAISKMMLTKHGYSDKVEQDNTSSDGSMSPKPALDASQLPQETLDAIMQARNGGSGE